jgi:hypothetical protein
MVSAQCVYNDEKYVRLLPYARAVAHQKHRHRTDQQAKVPIDAWFEVKKTDSRCSYS